MCYLYRKECEEFLASHFDFLHSLKDNADKMFNGMFLGCGADINRLSKVLHRPLGQCEHKMEDLYYKEIEYIDLHWQSLNAVCAVGAWKDNNNISATTLAQLYCDGDEDAARAWLSSTEKCKRFCNKDKCKCISDMTIVDGIVAWKRRYKFIA